MDRRNFLATVASIGTTGIPAASSAAADPEETAAEYYGVLTDVTECIGCRKCEWACNQANHLPMQPLETFEDKSVFEKHRRPDAGHYTIVNEYPGPEEGGRPLWVKFQCFHCNHPACYSACLVTAFTKTATGAVVYNADRCMGCRYCMVACPFQIPAYEYDNPLTPKVQKCTLCYERISQEGGVPACVEICPPQCLTFGKRKDLLELAKQKIAKNPQKYVPHVYGEHEAGGTSWLYISSKPFEEIGLPVLGETAPPRLTEGLQHGIFNYFIPPVALFSILGMISWLYGEQNQDEHLPKVPLKYNPSKAAPMGKKLITPGVLLLLGFIFMGLSVAVYRFLFGIGAVTNLNDQYPWGLWIAVDVATGVALAAGGYTTAALAHIFHRKHYEPIVRPALLTALLGYTFVVFGLLVDLGRYYNIWHPMMPSMWSGHSVLFEVGMCVMAYLTVLYLEFVPIVVERFKGQVNLPGILSRFNGMVEGVLGLAERYLFRILPVIVIVGVVLSFLHQSSLGALMLIAPYKMHPLWYTPILPLLFLLTAFCVGFPMVIFESMIASRIFNQKPEMHILSPLSKSIAIFLAAYFATKLGDITIREAGKYLFDGSVQSYMFMAEMLIGVLIPLGMFLMKGVRKNPGLLFIASALVVIGVAFNRINVFITAYTPVYKVTAYFPSWGEIAVTLGLIAGLMLVYRIMVTVFPIIPTMEEKES
ncbi:MAG TPA: Ni/Fe-hydrogenase cytochrome b subunit [bacterium]|nr:Ni/Fe-hydrogenase cytochrome b subunit [bacterium]HPP00308.1 Ni/Fe-hydrogenase cytochrome b subunit [bacterium]